MFKSNGGFTLVELIIVIAILGLLAGIGVPAYNNIMNKANTTVESYKTEQSERVDDINAIASEYLGVTGEEETPAN